MEVLWLLWCPVDQELQVEPCWTTGNFVLGQETFEGGGGKVGKFCLVGLQNLTKCWRVTCWWTLGSHLSHTGLAALQVICVIIKKVWQAATCSVCNFPYAQNFFFFWPFNKRVWKATLDNVVLQLLCWFYFDHLSVSLVWSKY